MTYFPKLFAIATVVITIFASQQASARAKTDVVIVANGDAITGEIKTMTSGKLAVSTDYAGTIEIKWSEVREITSRYLFEVRTDEGERLYGKFALPESTEPEAPQTDAGSIEALLAAAGPASFLVKTGSGDYELDFDQVVEIRPIGAQLSDRLDIRVGATFYADPRTTTAVLSGRAGYEDERGRTGVAARFDRNSSTAEDDKAKTQETNHSTNVNLYRELWREHGESQRSYRLLNGVYSSNDALGISGQAALGFGFGTYLIDELGQQLNIAAGLQGLAERRADCRDHDETADALSSDINDALSSDIKKETCYELEGFISSRWHLYRFQSLDMDISLLGNGYPSITDSGRLRGDLQLQIDWELISNLYWSVNARAEYDNTADDLDSSKRKSDYSVTTGISWKY